MVQFLPLVLIFVVFYFLLIRPQQQKQKQHRAMLDALRRGDRVVTGGGILGTVSKVVGPEEVEVDIAQGVRVRGCCAARSPASSPSPTRPRRARPRARRIAKPPRPTRFEEAQARCAARMTLKRHGRA